MTKKTFIIILVAALALSAGGVWVVMMKHKRLGDAYAKQALRFIIEGEKNKNNDYNRNLHELEVQVSSPAERKSFSAICTLKKADDAFEEVAFAQVDAAQKDYEKEADSIGTARSINTVKDAEKELSSDAATSDSMKEKLDRAAVLLKEANKTIDKYNAERQRLCYEPLKMNIEGRSGDIPKECKLEGTL